MSWWYYNIKLHFNYDWFFLTCKQWITIISEQNQQNIYLYHIIKFCQLKSHLPLLIIMKQICLSLVLAVSMVVMVESTCNHKLGKSDYCNGYGVLLECVRSWIWVLVKPKPKTIKFAFATFRLAHSIKE